MATAPNLQAYRVLDFLKVEEEKYGHRFFLTPRLTTKVEAGEFCKDNHARLFSMDMLDLPEEEEVLKFLDDVTSKLLQNQARDYYWMGSNSSSSCHLVGVKSRGMNDEFGGKYLVSHPDCHREEGGMRGRQESSFPGICVVNDAFLGSSDIFDDEEMYSHIPYIYSCQCQRGYGYENCTKVEDDEFVDVINPGVTYCQSKEDIITIQSSSSAAMIVIDHVVLGRPFYQEGSEIDNEDGPCPREKYAAEPKDVCVARNALAVLTVSKIGRMTVKKK